MLLFPAYAAAYELPSGWSATICGIIPCSTGAPGAAGLSMYINNVIIVGLEVGFVGIAAFMLLIYSITLVSQGYEENTATQIKTGYAYAIAGAAIVSLSHMIVQAFSPTLTGPSIINTQPLNTGFSNVIIYFKIILSVAVTFNIIYQAVRLIVSHEQGEIDKAKTRLLFGFIGVAIILLANAIVTAVNPQTGSASSLAIEIVGVTNFLLTIFGFMAVLAIIIAGILLVISVDESLKDKSKNIIKTAIISLAVILAAYAIVSTFGNEEFADQGSVSLQTATLQFIALFTVPSASAQGIGDTITAVGGLLPPAFTGPGICAGSGGVCGFVNIALYIVNAARPILFIFTVFVIVLTGFRMVIVQDEDILQKSIKIISAAVTGLVMVFLIEPFILGFYGFTGEVPRGNMQIGAKTVATEVLGLINWALVIVGVVAVTMIVIAGLRALAKAGSDEGISELRRAIFSIVAGLLLIVFTEILNNSFGLSGVGLPGGPAPTLALSAIVRVVQFLLGFLALVAVIMFVYAGFLMILNFGSEEQFTKAKSLLYRVVIGIVVIIVSFAIISLVIQAATGNGQS